MSDTHDNGGSLGPLEAMFVKSKAAQAHEPGARKARMHERWGREQGRGASRDVTGEWG